MKRQSTSGGEMSKARRRKAESRRTSSTVVGGRGSGADDLQKQLDQRTRERDEARRQLAEALEQHTANSEVLKVIADSSGNLQPVFQSILANAVQLCDAKFGTLFRYENRMLHVAAQHGTPPALVKFQNRRGPFFSEPGTLHTRVLKTKRVAHTADYSAEPSPGTAAKVGGARSTVIVPILKDDRLIGTIVIYRTEVRPFTEKQIELVSHFATQAAIAIENTRLLSELRQRTDDLTESLEQQTATSEVLKVISSSPGELEPVFQTMLENAVRICGAKFGNMFRYENGEFYPVARLNLPPALDEFLSKRGSRPPNPGSVLDKMWKSKQVLHTLDDAASPSQSPPALLGGARTHLAVPLLKDGELVGAITIYRQEVRPFEDKQIELVQNFAAQAVIAIENMRLLNELRQRTDDLSEALEQQTATAEVLQVINSSPGDLAPVFEAILEKAHTLCGATIGALEVWDGDHICAFATRGLPGPFDELIRQGYRPGPDDPHWQLVEGARFVQVPDSASVVEPTHQKAVKLAGIRTFLAVALRKENLLLGRIVAARKEVRPFSDKEIALLQSFAAQAVIAIENARLLNELRQRTDDLSESLEQQTATSEVLKVISSAHGELQPVFDAILENATRICEAKFGNLILYDGEIFRRVALHNAPAAWAADQQKDPRRTREQAPILYRLADIKAVVHIGDVTADPSGDTIHKFTGARTLLIVPMLKGGELVGGVGIYRQEVRPFTEKQIGVLQNFAAQAVIAIENARLLNELRESLQQQTATADVLKVISRSTFDLQAVFKALVDSAAELCKAKRANIALLRDGGFEYYAAYGFDADYMTYMRSMNLKPERGSVIGRAVLEAKVVHVDDVLGDAEYSMFDAQKRGGFRTALGVPLMREGLPIGAIFLTRDVVEPFTQQQIELVSIFAAQAVIAIENTRLLNELRQRTDDLTESLEQQTATSEVLKVISTSPGDLKPVFQAMLENATRICEAKFGNLFLREGDAYRIVAVAGEHEYVERRRTEPLVILRDNPGVPLDTLTATKAVIHINDISAERTYIEGNRRMRDLVEVAGARTLLAVPMLRERELIGSIVIYRQEVRPFTDKQIELVSNFAAQAVIAIENTRLLNELRESLQQQTATADVLKVISRSTFDLQAVLNALVESATHLCGADKAAISRPKGDTFEHLASYGYTTAHNEYMRTHPIPANRGSVSGRVLQEGKVIHIPDVTKDQEYTLADKYNFNVRTLLGVPLMREGAAVGVIILQRETVRPFTDKQIELATTFADQAGIAIENVRLFESVEARTRELAQSLEDLQTAQDRLVQTQKLASLGQLTAGIAHEIKNPLNFVNNFSSLSTEMLGELQEALQRGQFDPETRAEIDDLTDTLRANLDKIEQHGKRADSIVKNMLLHSREGTGEHRPVDINAVVEESLNLAYHGARAEKQGFSITLERSFDPTAGEVDVFPQDITRVLLNLISNGFYAATKRKAETNRGDYEPTLAAATKNLGDRVEISIRDNGTGIPSEVKEKMFNPFFTTKPAGEGTGLGLSISHDIIVKQHGGLIEVETEPGTFTEFKIILPRAAATIAKTGGRS